MTPTELRNKVIGKINHIDDEELLQEVYRLLEIGSEPFKIYQLSNEEETAITQAQEEVNNGNYITNAKANNDIDEWLKK